MKQLLQDLSKGETMLLDTPAPAPRAGRVLVQVRASAVSAGTERMLVDFAKKSLAGKALARPDLVRQTLSKVSRDGLLPAIEAVSSRLDQPLPLGYSCAGVVVEVGEGIARFSQGARVACAGAGYANHAEFVSVPENLCVPIADEVSFEEGAYVTLGAIALHGLRLGQPQIGESIAVIGLGLLGQMAAQMGRTAGARVLGIDLDDERVSRCRQFGIDAIPRPSAEERALSWTEGKGFDLVLITADAPTNDPVELASEIARDRGRVVAVGNIGLGVPRNTFYRKELQLLVSRSYGPGRYDTVYEEQGIDYSYGYVRWTEGRNMEEVARLLADRKLSVSPLITHRIPIEKGPSAYDLIDGRSREASLGVVLLFGSDTARESRVNTMKEEAAAVAGTATVSVLGAGAFATSVMLPVIARSGVSLRGVASASGTKAKLAADRYGFMFAASQDGDVMQDKSTSCVVILTRHHLHAAQVEAALSAGKHVFVEKPLCLTVEELARLDEARTKHPAQALSVGFNRRFAPFTRALKAFFHEVSEPKVISLRVNAGVLPDEHWLLDPAQGGGRLIGEGCHFIDWANFIAGAQPTGVFCKPLSNKPGEQDWSICMDYADGSAASIQYFSQGAPGVGKERYEVHAGGKSAILEDFKTLRLFSPRGGSSARRAWLRSDKGHAAHWGAFVSAVEKGGPAPIQWKDVLGAMRTVFAAKASLRSGEPRSLEE